LKVMAPEVVVVGVMALWIYCVGPHRRPFSRIARDAT
jgi:hypothetical protein